MSARVTAVATAVAHLVGPGSLKLVNGHLSYEVKDGSPLRLDPEALENVFCYGRVNVSEPAFKSLFAAGVELAFLSKAGNRCHGRVVHEHPSAGRLRLAQYRAREHRGRRLDVARWIVAEKVASQRRAVRHAQRHGHRVSGASSRIKRAATECGKATSLGSLRGIEGGAAQAWFKVLAELLHEPWSFTRRVRRPPTDPVNALLSLGYTWLHHRVEARLLARGLETCLGFLHDDRPGRRSLTCDLVEPLRVPAVDRWVVHLCNGGHLRTGDFRTLDTGAVHLQQDSFPRILASWEERWQSAAIDPALDQLIQTLCERLSQTPPKRDESETRPPHQPSS